MGRFMPTLTSAFQPLTEDEYRDLFVRDEREEREEREACVTDGESPKPISIVAYQPPWDREEHDVGSILEAAAERWQSARFFSMTLVRGTPTGERIFAELDSLGFTHRKMPILDVFCGHERIDTLVLPQGEGGGEGAACPLFTEKKRVDALQRAIDAAQRRVTANRRWRERRRVLLALRQVRHDLRRLARYKDSGKLGRTWSLTKETNTIYRDPTKRVYSPERMRRERRKHLLGVLRHAAQVRVLQAEGGRLERRRRHLASLVFGLAAEDSDGRWRQRCDEEGCVLLNEERPAPPRFVSLEDRMARFETYLDREREACEDEGCVLLDPAW